MISEAVLMVIISLVRGEIAPRYLPLVPNGQGYNPGTSEEYNYGQGYNPGTSEEYNYGQGYNPGTSGHGGGYSTVAFSAIKASGCCTRGGRLVLERSLTNLGGGWSGATGEFTAPASGSYFFSWSGLSVRNQHLKLGLMRNGLEMVSSWADSEGYQSASGSVVLTLRRGDQVYLSVLEGEVFEPRDSYRGYTIFSGHRIG